MTETDDSRRLTRAEKLAIRRAQALRDVIYQLRGRILSEVDGLESTIDAILMFYFQPRDASRFQTWLLSVIGLGAKVAIVRDAAADLGVLDRVSATLSGLDKAVQIRNAAAHSHVTFNPNVQLEGGNWQEFLRWHSVRRSRKGVQVEAIEEAELSKNAEFVSTLDSQLTRLWIAFNAFSKGMNPRAALDDHDGRYPDQAKQAQ